jgi:hypothetical protein
MGERAQANQAAFEANQAVFEGHQSAAQVSAPVVSEVLTFGFKVQFLVPGERNPDDEDPPEHDPFPLDERFKASETDGDRARKEIGLKLWRYLRVVSGYANVACKGIPGRDDETSPVGPVLPSVLPKYNFWRIRPGKDVEPLCFRSTDDENCFWQDSESPLRFWAWRQTEMSSPVFATSSSPKRDSGWIRTTEVQDLKIDSVCRVLTKGMRINTSACTGTEDEPNSCGLSVFLGLGGNPIPETTIRRFITVVWLLEHAIFKLCAPWRRVDQDSETLTSRSLLSYIHADSLPESGPAELEELIGPRLQQAIPEDRLRRTWYIWHVPPSVLPKILEESGRTGCISIPGSTGHSVPHAVQINHAGSTLRPGEIKSWTNVCLRLFQLCHFYGKEKVHRWRLKAMMELVVDALNKDHYSGGDTAGVVLLKMLGLKADIPIWTQAHERWTQERLVEYLKWDPFVPPQVPRDAAAIAKMVKKNGDPVARVQRGRKR